MDPILLSDNLSTVYDDIIHIADVHIPSNLHVRRKREYECVFDNLYNFLNRRCARKSVIVIAGDLLHVKMAIETDTIVMARSFLTRLSKYAPTLVAIGNHDFTENNLFRIDSISAICHGIPNVYGLITSGLYNIGNIYFVFSSLVDKILIKRSDVRLPATASVYAVYHGTVNGSINCNNSLNNHTNYVNVNDFIGYTGVLLGHIHKHQYLSPSVAYVGSLVQQNYGESVSDHGVIVWNVSTSTSQFYDIDNPYAFVTVDITDGVLIDESVRVLSRYKHKELYVRCKLRNTSQHALDELAVALKDNYAITELSSVIVSCVQHRQSAVSACDNTDDVSLIRQYVPDTKYTDEIIELHRLYCTTSQCTDLPYWTVIRAEFQNMFGYGNDIVNVIDFNSGIYSICAPNTTGKSSAIYVILYGLFDQVSHNMTKKSDILHKGKLTGYIKLTLRIDDKEYVIHKKSKSKKQNNKLIPIFTTDFYQLSSPNNINLNGSSHTHTVKIIQSYIGSFDVFVAHNLIAPKICTSVMNMTPTDRLKHFHKIYNTERYAECVVAAKKNLHLLESQLSNLIRIRDIRSNDLDNMSIDDDEPSDDELLTLQSRIDTLTRSCQEISNRIGQIEHELGDFSRDLLSNDDDWFINKIRSLSDMLSQQSTTIPIDTYTDLLKLRTEYESRILPSNDTDLIVLQSELDSIFITDTSADLDVEYKVIQRQLLELNIKLSSVRHNKDCISCTTLLDDMNTVSDNVIKLKTERDILDNRVCKLLPFINNNISTKWLGTERYTELEAIDYIQKLWRLNVSPDVDIRVAQEYRQLHLTVRDPIFVDEQRLDYFRRERDAIRSKYSNNLDTSRVVKMLEAKLSAADIAFISKSEIQSILALIRAYESGDVIILADIEVELAQLEQDVKSNLDNNKLIAENIEITAYNELVSDQKYLIAHTSLVEYVDHYNILLHQLNETILQLECNITYTTEYQLKSIQSKLLSTLHDIQDNIALRNRVNDLRNRINVLSNNIKYRKLLSDLSQTIAIVQMRDELRNLQHTMVMRSRYVELNQLRNDLDNHNLTLDTTRLNYHRLASTQATIREAKKRYGLIKSELETTIREITEFQQRIDLLTIYIKIFSPSEIPYAILCKKLQEFDTRINTIFKLHTQYEFKYDQSIDGKLSFILLNKNTGLSLESDRLSGYESIILHLAINSAIDDRCNMFIIDESLDCIDQHRFIHLLPIILNLMRQYYRSIIIISHRDLPVHTVDYRITIRDNQLWCS